MKYNKLGKTGLKVSAISLGGIPLQKLTREQAVNFVNYALDQGINYIDTARGYTVSESYIGDAVRNRRSDVYIATKGPGLTKEDMLSNMRASLDTMDIGYIDLYQVHNVGSEEKVDIVFGEGGAYEAFLEMKAAGKVRHFGLTAHKLHVLEHALDRYSDKIESIMFPYNIVEVQGEELFRRACELGIAVIVMKPVAGGNLTDVDLALRFCLSNPNVSVVIPGMGDKKEVDANIAVDTSPLSEQDKERCEQIVAELGHDFCRRCGYCAPCTVGIDIPSIFTFQNYLNNYELADWAKGRYAALKVNASQCIGCGICEQRCPYELPIREKLARAAHDFATK